MADTSLNENRIGLLIWQTSNLWQSKLRNKLSKYNISFNEYLIIETIYNLSIVSNNISQIDIVNNSFSGDAARIYISQMTDMQVYSVQSSHSSID